MSTSGQEDALQRAVRVVMAMLPQDRDAMPDQVEQACGMAHSVLSSQGDSIDLLVLRKEVESRVSVWQDPSAFLEDDTDHIEWLPGAKASINWNFWDRYRRYLEDTKLMPRQVVRRLHESTDNVLGHFENPERPGRWRRYGMVVGQVQSGKTGNYIGLACKAADAGYNMIVILAGIDNSLRSQTQLRVDEGVLGFDTQYQQRYDQDKQRAFGVGAIPGAKKLKVASFTTSAEAGDFKRTVAKNLAIPLGDYPVVLVVKKHVSILNNVRKWMVDLEGQHTADGKKKQIRSLDLLVIDDEADNASVNVAAADPDTNPTKVNAAIRELLDSFERTAYVGYTATPFANIYIDPDADHGKFGADIFPRHFIESLRPPSNYMGPDRVFGLTTEDPDEDDIVPLPVVRPITDYATWIPEKHQKDWCPTADLPTSLVRAINAFVLSNAARLARGQAHQHNSMLVHVTRFQDVQNRVAERISEHLDQLQGRIRYGDPSASVEQELRDLWDTDFVGTSAQFPVGQASLVSWSEVWENVSTAAQKIQVRVVNGTSRDALQYYDHRHDGLSVIAIGGNKLSRGLTLEGLSVSYYVRASKTYDTLLQMGRWFGFRPNYEDLCRLYIPTDLTRAYREITAANDELRREFEEMAALNAKPEEFGLRVRTSDTGLEITARNKMRRAMKIKLSFSGDLPETTAFDMRGSTVIGNFRLLERFSHQLDAMATSLRDGDSVVWRDISPEEIIDGFLADYHGSNAHRVRPKFIADYIRKANNVDELGSWTVRLVGSKIGTRTEIGAYELGLVTRKHINEDYSAGIRYQIKRVLSPLDESSDLDDQQKQRALDATKIAAAGKRDKNGNPRAVPTVPTGKPLRRQRRPDQPLLLIYPIFPLDNPLPKLPSDVKPLVGFAISFPFSRHKTEIEYAVNEIWQQQFLDEPDFDEEPDE